MALSAGIWQAIGLTAPIGRLYICTMAKNDPAKLFETELRKLEKRLDELVIITSQLKDDNRSLRDRQDSLINERASLVQKNEQARSRVESMITRLKAMEQSG